MTFGSLFSGIGGIDLGLERAGMTCKWQVEIDDFCRKVLTKHWPDVPKYKDIKEVKRLPYVDLIAGGFPCQDVSSCGKRKGIKEGTRSGLWFEFAKTIRMVRPKYIFVENVPGLLDRGIHTVLTDLAEIGYDAEWQSIPASIFDAPHQRERVFIVAYAHCVRCTRGLLFNKKYEVSYNSQWHTTKNIKTGYDWKCWLIKACKAMDGEVTSSDFLGVDDGLPKEMDRLKSLGNAVVPQVAEWIGKAIINSNKHINAELRQKARLSPVM